MHISQHSRTLLMRLPYSPYDLKIKELRESYHVYKRNDLTYKQNIENIIIEAIDIIKNKPDKLINLYNELNIQYAEIIKSGIDFDLNVDKIKFYIGANPKFNFNESDDLNISVMINDEEFNPKVKPLYIASEENIEQVTIIITGSNAILNEQININPYLTDISHELIHVFHSLKLEELNAKAGDAYYYANTIIKKINVDFPTALYFSKLNDNNLALKDLITIYCACIYYLDNSEYSAWLDTFNSEMERKYNFYKTMHKPKTYDDIKPTINSYIIFSNLLDLLKNNRNMFIKLHTQCPLSIQLILLKYFQKYFNKQVKHINEIDTKYLITKWIYRCKAFIKKCNQITTLKQYNL